MSETKTISKTETTFLVNNSTGEIHEEYTKISTFKAEKEPPYVKLYTEDIGRLYGLNTSSRDVLTCLARHMVYKTNVIVLYGPIKTIMMKELGMNKNTFNKAIDMLYKAGFLIRQSRACYVLDPCIFGSGTWEDVKRVRLSIEYNLDGSKTIKTSLTKGNTLEVFGRNTPFEVEPRQMELFDEFSK